jgi:hypothetical protein
MAEPSREDRPEYLGPLSEDEAEMAHLEARVVELKQRLVKEMCLTRTRTEMLEDFGEDYEEYL